jgi:hypothetical protein
MATYIRFVCDTCDAQLVNDEKRKAYVHANTAFENEPHKPVVRSVKVGEA